MTTCPDCEKTRELLLEILKSHVSSILYDRHKGPSVTNEDLIEVLAGVMKDLERQVIDAR